MAKLKRRHGRPAVMTAAIEKTILTRLAGGESLRQICANSKMPGTTTIYRRLLDEIEFRYQCERARQWQAELYFDEIIDIADSETVPIDQARLEIDARKKLIAKLLPENDGDQVVED